MAKEKEEEIKSPVPEEPAANETDKLLLEKGYTAEDLADLSETEKQGLLDKGEEETTEEKPAIDEATLKAIAGDKPKDEKPAEKPAEAKPGEKPAETPPAEKPPETPPAEKPAEKPAESEAKVTTDEELLRFRAVIDPSKLPAIDTVPAEIQAKFDDLEEKLEAGDIDRKQYNKERDTLNRQVTMQNLDAREAAKADLTWQAEQTAFLMARSMYMGKDMKSKALFGALTEAVKTLGADPKFQSVSGMELLLAADKEVKTAFGIAEKPGAAPPAASPAIKKDEKPPAPLPDHKTLGGVPAAAINPTDDAYSALDKLSGQAYEDALERMTPEQRDRYAAASGRG